MGRVKKWVDIKALQKAIDAYFKSADSREEPYTVSGLTLALGFVDTQSLRDYAHSPKYALIIKKAQTRIENNMETRLLSGKPPIGLIFALKNRFNWQDKQNMDITSGGETLGVVQLPTRDPK